MSVMSFKIGSIPTLRAMYVPMIRSGAVRMSLPWLACMLAAVTARVPWPLAAMLLLLPSLPGTEAATKSFHQTEDGCNCLRNCEIFGDKGGMGDCSDDGEKNKQVFL